jgi:hypothetical protein
MEAVETKDVLDERQYNRFCYAAEVSEDLISDRFHLTKSSWLKYPYEIKTLKDLTPFEVVPEAFAQIVRLGRPAPPEGLRRRDLYRICLQDHNILSALGRDPKLNLVPLLVYVLTHELVHLIRFYKFYQYYDVDSHQRVDEEARVHQITFELLRPLKMDGMETILDFYADHRGRFEPPRTIANA